MPTDEATNDMREWLRLSEGDAKVSPFDLRSLATQATLIVAHELGATVDNTHEARAFLQQHPHVLTPLEQYRTSSETLATLREAETRDEAEDARVNRERIAAREALVVALQQA